MSWFSKAFQSVQLQAPWLSFLKKKIKSQNETKNQNKTKKKKTPKTKTPHYDHSVVSVITLASHTVRGCSDSTGTNDLKVH